MAYTKAVFSDHDFFLECGSSIIGLWLGSPNAKHIMLIKANCLFRIILLLKFEYPMTNALWDQALIRKFCNTGHFRLLNQLKSELMASPLQRSLLDKRLLLHATPYKGSTHKAHKRPNALDTKAVEKVVSTDNEDTTINFTDRLNSINIS